MTVRQLMEILDEFASDAVVVFEADRRYDVDSVQADWGADAYEAGMAILCSKEEEGDGNAL